LGDFNAHSVSWGCFNNDSKGKIIQDLLLQQNLSLMNNGSITCLSPASGVQSAMDLSICDPSLYLDFSTSSSMLQHTTARSVAITRWIQVRQHSPTVAST